jgi:ABC-type multidrug transport system fused ATPase/permease subunit
VVTLFAVLSSIAVMLRVFTLTYFSWHGTKKLHEDMIARVFAAPVNLYFDTTPVGRILNRFSKDLSVAETVMPWNIGNFYSVAYPLLSVLAISVWVVPWVSIVFPLIFLIVLYFFKRSIAATKEVARVESVSKSPILNFLSESIAGSSTLRAYGNKDMFFQSSLQRLNDNILANQWEEAIPLWFSIRVDTVSLITMLLVGNFCIFTRHNHDPVMLSMLLSYVLSLQSMLIGTINAYIAVEKNMVSIERCLQMLTVPQEAQQGTIPANTNWPH